MNPLKEKLNELLKIIPKNKKIIYLDYPIHFNIGDLAIYHWTETFFEENNIEILERFNIHNISYNRIRNLIKKYWEIVFLWHGWWNMWDTYFEKAEKKRRNFVTNFSDSQIIFLPQSIHYKENKNLLSSIDIYNRENITLLVRDTKSFDLINNNYPKAKNFLMPDMAYYLADSKYLSQFKIAPTKEKIIISRIDEEKIDSEIADKTDAQVTDWLLMTWKLTTLWWYTLAALLKWLGILSFNSTFLTKLWYKLSKKLLSKWFTIIEDYKIVETDRLHGFIMSNLLGKEVITSDNYYGKIKNFKSTWNLK